MAKNALHQLTFEEAQERVTRLCASSEHCCSEISRKLTEWGLSRDDSDRILDMLIDEKYINESRYARAYTMDKFRFSHWGRVKIRSMLKLQRISDTDINSAAQDIPQKEYMDTLRHLIEQKQKTLKEQDDYARYCKVVRFALQRGFEMNLITEILG